MCIGKFSTTRRGKFILNDIVTILRGKWAGALDQSVLYSSWHNFATSYFYSVFCVLSGRRVLRKIQGMTGVYGMVAPCDKVCLLHPIVGSFTTGDTIRVVLPAEVIGNAPWTLENNKSCGLKLTYELPRYRSLGTLTVRVCWCTTVFRDEEHFIASHFKYWCLLTLTSIVTTNNSTSLDTVHALYSCYAHGL